MSREAGQDWTTEELAAEAKLNPSRIRQLLLSGEIRGVKRAGIWFIPDDEARRWLDKRNERWSKY